MELTGAIIAAAVIAGVFFAIFSVFRSFLRVCRPNEVIIISGSGGRGSGYRMIRAGEWAIQRPFVEETNRLDLTVMQVHINIEGAFSKGGIPLNVQAVANVKVDSGDTLGNAVERFLGRGRREIKQVAQETLEGNLRSVLAGLTPEQVNESRLELANRLAKTAEEDLEGLGLHMDTLKIQNVSDERDYLDSIGRESIAKILKVAEVSESRAVRTAEEEEASAQGRGEVARRNAQREIQKKQNELREIEAELELKAKSEEERAEARALAARAEAEQELQQVRTELEKIRLHADVVIPAEAEKVAREFVAAGEAAEVAERGRAMAEVLRMMTEVWQDAGDAAMDVFILQRMEQIMEKVADAANQVEVREVALIDGGSGETLPNYVSAFPGIVGGLFEEMRESVGLDIGGVLTGQRGGAGGNGGPPSGPGGSGGGSDADSDSAQTAGHIESKDESKSLGSRLAKKVEENKQKSAGDFGERQSTQNSVPNLSQRQDDADNK